MFPDIYVYFYFGYFLLVHECCFRFLFPCVSVWLFGTGMRFRTQQQTPDVDVSARTGNLDGQSPAKQVFSGSPKQARNA